MVYFRKHYFQICPDLAHLCLPQVVVEQRIHGVVIAEVCDILFGKRIPVAVQVLINRRIILFLGKLRQGIDRLTEIVSCFCVGIEIALQRGILLLLHFKDVVSVLNSCLFNKRINNEIEYHAKQRKEDEHHGHDSDVSNAYHVSMKRAVMVDHHAQVKQEKCGGYQDRYHPYTGLLQMLKQK